MGCSTMNDQRLQQFREAQDRVRSAQRTRDRDKGALQQLLRSLKELGCGNLKDAQQDIKQLTQQEKELTVAFDAAQAEFGEKYKTYLEELSK
jgi:ABC-type transporter Mla subunit MlaD